MTGCVVSSWKAARMVELPYITGARAEDPAICVFSSALRKLSASVFRPSILALHSCTCDLKFSTVDLNPSISRRCHHERNLERSSAAPMKNTRKVKGAPPITAPSFTKYSMVDLMDSMYYPSWVPMLYVSSCVPWRPNVPSRRRATATEKSSTTLHARPGALGLGFSAATSVGHQQKRTRSQLRTQQFQASYDHRDQLYPSPALCWALSWVEFV